MVAILGGGSGGIALATLLEKKGQNVTVWNRSKDRIKPIIDNGGYVNVISHENNKRYKVKITKVTSNLKETISNNEIFFVVTPGSAHEDIARQVSPFINNKKIFVLIPGRTYGSIAFKKNLGKMKKYVSCYESQTLLHASRSSGKKVDIFKTKPYITYSSVNEKNKEEIKKIKNVFPELLYTRDYYSVTLNNIGAMFHPVPAIMNLTRIENKEEYFHYTQGISPTVSKLIEKMDKERGLVCKKMGARYISAIEWMKDNYGTDGKTLRENLQQNKGYSEVLGPNTIDHRYIYDDLLTGLVPIYKSGKKHKVQMPVTKSFIDFISSLMGVDYMKDGRFGM